MRRGATYPGLVAMLAIAGCDGEAGKLTIRSTGTPLSAQAAPLSSRVAEARAQFALGNIALALETFRRAVREEPRNIAAITGVAACYDRMGRFDVSRQHYEAALAVEPANEQALAALAASLDLQGKGVEAAAVRGEIRERRDAVRTAAVDVPATPAPAANLAHADRAVTWTSPGESDQRIATTVAATAVPGAPAATPDAPVVVAPIFPTAPARSVTIRLPAPRPYVAPPLPQLAASTVRVPAPAAAASLPEVETGPRLERTSMGEVALVTLRTKVVWRAPSVRPAAPSGIAFAALHPTRAGVPIRVLNAARVDRLAANTRTLMARRGWKNVVIGNAGAVRARSVVLYPASVRHAAQRLAAQLGFLSALRTGRGGVTVILGSDATALVRRRAAS